MRAGLAMYFVTLDDPELMRDRGPDRRGARDRALLQHPARRRLRDRDQPAHLDGRLPGGPQPSVPRREARARRDLGRRAAHVRRPRSARAARRCATSTSSSSTRGRVQGRPVSDTVAGMSRGTTKSTASEAVLGRARGIWHQNCDARSTAARHARARQHRRHPVGERPGAAAQRRRRAARRLRARAAPSRGRLVARPPRAAAAAAAAAVRRVRTPGTEHRRLPLLLRADARPEVDPVPAAPAAAASGACSTTSAPTSAARRPASSRSASAPTRRSSAPTTRSAGCPRRT